MPSLKELIQSADTGSSQIITKVDQPLSGVGGLPHASVTNERPIYSVNDRKVIHIFLPQMGVFKFFINPKQINYGYSKITKSVQTKGGFSNQYWGESLPTLKIQGTTGSSGIEGINALYEAYRSEQYAFDPSGLLLSEQAFKAPLEIAAKNIIDSSLNVANSIASGGNVGQSIGSLFSDALLPNNSTIYPDPPTLAQLAFSVEIYYSGCVYRGWFEDFSHTEDADNFLHNYNISFKVTQKRGYRLNYLPWHKSPIGAPHDSPYSFEDDGKYTTTQPTINYTSLPTGVKRQVTQLQRNVTGR